MRTLLIKTPECQAEKLDLDTEAKGDRTGVGGGEARVEGWGLNARMEEGCWVTLGSQKGSW